MSPPLICPKNIDFVIFMQFLVILPKLPPPATSRPHLGNPVQCAELLPFSKKNFKI